MELFFELIRIFIGETSNVSSHYSDEDWSDAYNVASKQSLLGLCFASLEKLPQEVLPSNTLLLKWISVTEQIRQRNVILDQQSNEVGSLLKQSGFVPIILKGQGLSGYYGNLSRYRQSGDIDIWLQSDSSNKRITTREIVASINPNTVYDTNWAHVGCKLVGETEVELHPVPAFFRCPWYNKRLQNWFDAHREDHKTCELGFEVPTVGFNLVYLMVHMYHHMLFEGIGLKQFVDYFFVLKNSTEMERVDALKSISAFGMKRFAAGVMYIMNKVFGIDETFMFVEPDTRTGEMILHEIMAGGNFGHYDTRYKELKSSNLVKHGLGAIRKKLPLFRLGPWEIICSPFWSVWQVCWRKRNGYL